MESSLIIDTLAVSLIVILSFLIGLFIGVYLSARRQVHYTPTWAELEDLKEVKAVRDFLHDYRIADNDLRHEQGE